jgi:hypothetical protein
MRDHEPLTDLPKRRATHGTDDEGRRLVNAHGDVDVVRTPEGNYPVAVPIESGDYLRLDDEEFRVVDIRANTVRLDTPDQAGSHPTTWGVHAFNTTVRDADTVVVQTGGG